MSLSRQDKLLRELTRYLKRVAPGALAILNTIARRRYSQSYIELLAGLDLPSVLSLLREVYREPADLEVALYMFAAKPLVEVLGLQTRPRRLARLILEEKWDQVYELLGKPRLEARIGVEEYTNIVTCSYAIELAAVKAYEALSRVLGDPVAAAIAQYISNESKLHADIVKVLARELGLSLGSFEEAARTCRDEYVKEYLELVQEIEEKLAAIQGDRGAIADYFEKLSGLERIADEENYSRAIMPLITLLFRGKRRRLVEKIVDLIASDERHHEELAKIIAEYLRNSEE